MSASSFSTHKIFASHLIVRNRTFTAAKQDNLPGLPSTPPPNYRSSSDSVSPPKSNTNSSHSMSVLKKSKTYRHSLSTCHDNFFNLYSILAHFYLICFNLYDSILIITTKRVINSHATEMITTSTQLLQLQ